LFHNISLDMAFACLGGDSSCPLTPAEVQTINCLPTPVLLCTYSDPLHFDYVQEVIRFDEYARTAPVVLINAPGSPAATGWYNAAVLGGQGSQLHVKVNATDYYYPTGITRLGYQDNFGSVVPLTPGTNAPFVNAQIDLSDGFHLLTYSATDGAIFGMVGNGNSGGGPGTTPQPISFNVDTVPPTITCQNSVFILNQPATMVTSTVTDAPSGPVASLLSTTAPANAVGTFSVPFTAFDVAGNSATGSCSYIVTYGVDLGYDPTKPSNSGSTVPVIISLLDFAGANVSSHSIALTPLSVTNTVTIALFPPASPRNTNPR